MNSSASTFPALAFLAGPWLFLGLILSGPFLVLLTVFAAAVLLAGVFSLPVVAIVFLRRHLTHRQVAPAPAPVFELQQVTA